LKVIIDRFEGEFAIVEMPDKSFLQVPRQLFVDAKESDVVSIAVDSLETERRKQHITSMMDKLFVD